MNSDYKNEIKTSLNEHKRLNTVIEDMKVIFNEKGKKSDSTNKKLE